MSKPTSKELIVEINALHAENILAAHSTAERAIAIGVKLHQLKESVEHGKFEGVVEKELPGIGHSCRSRYMGLAEKRLIEETAIGLLAQNSHSGNSDSGNNEKNTVLAIEATAIPAHIWQQSEEIIDKVSWFNLPFKVEQLIKSIKGKELGELFREYGIIRNPKKTGTHERGQRDLRQEIEDAAEVDEQACKDWISDTLMLASEESPVLGEQKTAMLHRLAQTCSVMSQRVNALLKARGGKSSKAKSTKQ